MQNVAPLLLFSISEKIQSERRRFSRKKKSKLFILFLFRFVVFTFFLVQLYQIVAYNRVALAFTIKI